FAAHDDRFLIVNYAIQHAGQVIAQGSIGRFGGHETLLSPAYRIPVHLGNLYFSPVPNSVSKYGASGSLYTTAVSTLRKPPSFRYRSSSSSVNPSQTSAYISRASSK